MGLTALNVSILVAPVWSHCGTNNAFTVTLTVTGSTNGRGATYWPSVWDDDGWANIDDCLSRGAITAIAGAVNFTRVHTFDLDCASDCEVVGPAGGSGEARAQIYGYVEETNRMFGKLSAESMRVPVWCHTEEECPLNQVADSSTHGRLRLDGLDGVRGDLDSFAVVSQARPPEDYQMAGGLGLGLRAFRVGDDGLDFGAPIAVVAKLTGNEMRILDEMDGVPVRFVPEKALWVPMEGFEYDEGVLRFKTQEGGMFGVAPHERYSARLGKAKTYFVFDRGTVEK